MHRHPLYDEFEEEGYSFSRVIIGNGQIVPKVVKNNDLEDYCAINFMVIVNGQPQIFQGPNCTPKTVEMLKRFVEELSKNNGQFIDYDFTTDDNNDNDDEVKR